MLDLLSKLSRSTWWTKTCDDPRALIAFGELLSALTGAAGISEVPGEVGGLGRQDRPYVGA